MAHRSDPFKPLVDAGLMTVSSYDNPFAGIEDWDELADHHCEGRNQCVAFVLLHLQMMLARGLVGPPAPPSVVVNAAIRQMDLPPREDLPEPPEFTKALACLTLSPEQQKRLREKCFRTQDAHCLPCQVLLNTQPIQDFIAPPAAPDRLQEYAHLNAQFGVVQRIATMFNETDSHAETSGLKQALAAGCQMMIRLQAAGKPAAERAFPDAYRAYEQCARAALARAILANQTELQTAQAQKDAGEVIYRLVKLRMLRLYQTYTEINQPEQYDNTSRWRLFVSMWE